MFRRKDVTTLFDDTAARAILEARQQLRKEAALPPLNIDTELTAMREEAERVDEARSFAEWKASNPALVKAVRDES